MDSIAIQTKEQEKYAEHYRALEHPVIFIGVCCINRWREILVEQLTYIKDSLLYNYVQEIHVILTGPDYTLGDLHACFLYVFGTSKKVRILVKYFGASISEYEKPYLVEVQKYALMCVKKTPLLYLHSKGVTRQGNINIPGHVSTDNWRQFMQYFLIKKWKSCLHLVCTGSDTVGCNYNEEPSPHYSGNFWWATSDHIANLPYASDLPWNVYEKYAASKIHYRYMYEFWIGMKKDSTMECVYTSPTGKEWDHYNDPLPESRYSASGDAMYKELEWEE
jgi:hypothetical protein